MSTLLARPKGGAMTPRRLCMRLLNLKRFVQPIDDVVVEVYNFVFEDARTSEWRLLTDSASYEVQACDVEQNKLLIDLSPDGQRPLIVQDDVAIVIRKKSNRSIACRYFFHT